ncbi:hypothetical protein [Modestobacter marinus]|uniref:hypothetical protein n=1 Tax=Modestobacter marinus TaxID=477641 RepID=UPI001C941E0C|nr:hypothetical protein [Modestobacter marinus]
MSVFETETPYGSAGELLVSPFSVPEVEAPTASVRETPVSALLETPFAEALATVGEEELEAEAVGALAAELEDEEFTEALEALVDEAAGRHLRSAGTWSHEADGGRLAAGEVEQWLEALAAEADHRLAQLEEHYADRPVDAVSEGELEAMVGSAVQDEGLGGPVDVQEQFLGKLVRKAAKAVKGVAKLAKRGIAMAGKLLPVGRVFALLRKLVRPLLQRVLAKAVGSLPPALQPAARRLAGRIPGVGEVADEAEGTVTSLGERFDAALAEAVLAPGEAAAAAPLALFEDEATASRDGGSALEALDEARQRLARQLREAEAGADPTAEMEQFIPVVMAAMPLVKLGVKVIGRQKIVGFIAKLLADLIRPMVGAQVAQPLSQHVANAGLRLLGLEAEARDTIGAEALVAAAEDTLREVLSLPEASLEQELLLEAAVQEAFEEAAVRHFPARVLRTGLDDGEAEEQERGIWVPMPRGAGVRRRYRTYSAVRPVTISRLMARSVIFREGDTLEERLLDEGVTAWPVPAEVTTYELLPGGQLGHLAAFEADGESPAVGALQFSELEDEGWLPGPRRGWAGLPSGLRRPGRTGRRIVRLRVAGRPVRRRRRFGLQLDLTGPAPQLVLSVLVSERLAHLLAGELARRRHAVVVAAVRRLVGPARQRAIAARLARVLTRQGITLPEGGSVRLAAQLAAAVERVVAARLPEAAATLAAAAKDPAPGITLAFAFPFADRAALAGGVPGEPTMSIRPGTGRA